MVQSAASSAPSMAGEAWVDSDERAKPDLSGEDAAAIVTILEERYHSPLREALGRLEVLAREVERLHGDDPRYPVGLAGRIEVAAIDLIDHMEKEERVLFPAIRRGLTIELTPPVRVMRREHEDQHEALEELRERTDGYALPEGLSAAEAPRWRALYRDLAAFDEVLEEHLRIEDEVLFPRLVGR